MPHDDIERLKQIQAAYGIQEIADLGGLADTIIGRRELLLSTDKPAVMMVLTYAVEIPAAFDALKSGKPVSTESLQAAARAAEQKKGTTPAESVAREVLEDIADVLGQA